METTTNTLTEENYSKGFLIDEEWIGGVTVMEGGVYSAYVSHYLTGETLVYQEFENLRSALAHLNAIPKNWVFEGVGCSAKTSAPKVSGSGCGSGACGSCGVK